MSLGSARYRTVSSVSQQLKSSTLIIVFHNENTKSLMNGKLHFPYQCLFFFNTENIPSAEQN
jgi:hypothetical protein